MSELRKKTGNVFNDVDNLYKHEQEEDKTIINLSDDLHDSIFSDGGIGKNLVNKDDIVKDVYLNASDSLESAGGWCVTNYIKLKSNTSYSLSPKQNKSACIGLYTESKTLTRTIPLSNLYATGVFTTNSNEVFVRISNETASIGGVQLEEGTSATAYEPYIMSNKQLTDANDEVKSALETQTISISGTDYSGKVKYIKAGNLLTVALSVTTTSTVDRYVSLLPVNTFPWDVLSSNIAFNGNAGSIGLFHGGIQTNTSLSAGTYTGYVTCILS